MEDRSAAAAEGIAPGESISRRAFLSRGALFLAAPGIWPALAARSPKPRDPEPVLRIGLVADVHYAEKPPQGNRFYRDSLRKMEEAVSRFQEARCDLAVELGDFIDTARTEDEEIGSLQRIAAAFSRFPGERHHVLGNHCVSTLTKRQFLSACGARERRCSFDRGEFHLVVLDACFRGDGTPYGKGNFEWTDAEIPPEERRWLSEDLAATRKRVLVFVHHRLDVGGDYGIRSAPEVRGILEKSGNVAAVFQGHYHKNDHQEIGGIHYLTLAAMAEGPAGNGTTCAVCDLFDDGRLRVHGFGTQDSWDLVKGNARKMKRV